MLEAGQKLSQYRLIEKIGEGGMGSVWKALDTNLDREVALKLLPSRVADDPAALARFQREARAVAALSHPHILAVHDFGSDAGVTFVVMELLDGETLKQRLGEGPLPLRKAVELAGQIARGLAAAHDKGIVHRDLKPDNVFVTRDGQVKILDFGLAKLDPAAHGARPDAEAPTMTRQTDPGVVMGTVGYMSPEQVRGQDADARSDIFSLGVVLFEMVTGRRAFSGDSTVETLNAILKEEPPDLQEISREVSPALERIIRHCLEKRPEERFQSARDVAFDLQAHADPSSSAIDAMIAPQPAIGTRKPAWLAGVVLLAVIALAAGIFVGRRGQISELPRFEAITHRRGTVWSARFGPDGETVFYSASWEGGPMRVYVKRPGDIDSTVLDLDEANLFSVSASGDLAVGTNVVGLIEPLLVFSATLARAEPGGASARELIENVHQAEWSPKRKQLAIVREADGVRRLEFPPGNTLYETKGRIRYPRFSPEGDLIAFIDHPFPGDDMGSIAVVDLEGNRETLSKLWNPLQALAWSPSGDEVWFATAGATGASDLMGVALDGRSRVIARLPGPVLLHDVSRTGKVLLSRFDRGWGMLGRGPGETQERNLSWVGDSLAIGISNDGMRLLFSEQGTERGYLVALRRLDGSSPVRLGVGMPIALSPDGQWAVVGQGDGVVLLPTGAGEAKPFKLEEAVEAERGGFFPGGERLWATGRVEGRPARTYEVSLDGKILRAITGEEHLGRAISPDGEWIAARCPDGFELHRLDGAETRSLGGLLAGDEVLQWSADGRSLFVARRRTSLDTTVYRLDVETGGRTVWRELEPEDRTGTVWISNPVVNPAGTAYAYTYARILSELYVAEGFD